METLDYYQLLGVSRHASEAVLKRAYRSRILELHPDHNPDDSAAAERTRRIIEAYRTLSDPASRRLYDAALAVPAPCAAVPGPRVRFGFPPSILRTLGFAITLAVILYIVLAAVQAICGDQGIVFRPDTTYLHYDSDFRSYPLLIHPDMYESAAWYSANEYQLSLASPWMAERMREAYLKAAAAAELRGDAVRAEFFRSSAKQAAAVETSFTVPPRPLPNSPRV